MNGAQCRMARAALNWRVSDLAKRASVSTETVVRIEHGAELRPRTVAALREVFEAEGLRFFEADAEAGVAIRKDPPG